MRYIALYEVFLDFLNTNYLLVIILVRYPFNNSTVTPVFILISRFPVVGNSSWLSIASVDVFVVCCLDISLTFPYLFLP